MRHLQDAGYQPAPRVVSSGFAPDGRETITFVAGSSAHPGPWPETVLPLIGFALRDLHSATASSRPPADARWQDWFGRALGSDRRVIGHCDLGPWNILAADDLSTVTFVNWETAGPVDPIIELAQVCWLNAQLHDDDIACRRGLAEPSVRAQHVRLIVEGYGLGSNERSGLVDRMIELAVCDCSRPGSRRQPGRRS